MSLEEEGELERIDALFELMSGVVQGSSTIPADAGVARHFLASSRLSAAQRVDIYREQFWLRHEESLREDFPGTRALIGPAWEDLVRGYLKEFPPTTPSLRELGFQLPDYLEKHGGIDSSVFDMARLERAYLEVFDAPDEPPLDPAHVGALSPEQWPLARLGISGALRLLELGSHAADLRRLLRSGALVELEERAKPTYLTVYRRELGLWDKEISRTAYALLGRLASGQALGAACEATAEERPEAARELDTQLGEWFADWARLGWITRVDVP
jgi:hypothetical protein